MNIELKILDPRLKEWGFPRWGSDGAACLDLYACLDAPLFLRAQEPAQLISTGISFWINQPGWVGLVAPRSGAAHQRGLVLGNTLGIIDSDYQGPCMVSAWNRKPTGWLQIEPGDRIAQLMFVHITRPDFDIVEEFSAVTGRGEGGLGSTGT